MRSSLIPATLIGMSLLCTALPARAVEVSLEENKAERGNIGYVDMHAVFLKYPETQKAKQNFEEVVRQAEDQVNTRKTELISMRAEITRLKMERDFVSKTPATLAAPKAPSGQPSPGTEPAGGSAANAAKSTITSSGQPLISLPGLTPAETSVSGAASNVSQVKETTIQDMDQKIAEKTQTLQSKEAEFKTYQAQVEKNLLDLESRRTEILLGKIYVAVQDVARQEGISVVVDKSQILFGHKAVDLTPKVLEKLKNL